MEKTNFSVASSDLCLDPRWVVRVTRPVGKDQDWECPEVKRGVGGG